MADRRLESGERAVVHEGGRKRDVPERLLLGTSCGTPSTWSRKSLNISFEAPATAWQVTQPAEPKNSSAPCFSSAVSASSSPRA
jgi:hypothetical protein